MKALARALIAAATFLELFEESVVDGDDAVRTVEKALARALVATTAFLELSGDEVVDPDDALRTLENIGYELQTSTPEERKLIQEVLTEEQRVCVQPEMRSFLDPEKFLFAFGLLEDTNRKRDIEAQNDLS